MLGLPERAWHCYKAGEEDNEEEDVLPSWEGVVTGLSHYTM